MGKLFILFVTVPLFELWVLVKIGRVWGANFTVGLVVVTAILGAFLAKREGKRVWESWQMAVQLGRPPSDGLLSTAMVVVGGILLLTPGVFTDVLGILLLVPLSRRWLAQHLRQALERSAAFHLQQMHIEPGIAENPFTARPPPYAAQEDVIIDAEVIEKPSAKSESEEPSSN